MTAPIEMDSTHRIGPIIIPERASCADLMGAWLGDAGSGCEPGTSFSGFGFCAMAEKPGSRPKVSSQKFLRRLALPSLHADNLDDN